MVLPSLDGIVHDVGRLGDLAQDIDLDAEAIQDTVDELRKQADLVRDAIMARPAEAAYGVRGDYVRYHSQLAWEKVSDTLQSMVAGLDDYALAIKKYAEAQGENDQAAARAMRARAGSLLDRGEQSVEGDDPSAGGDR